MAKKIDVLIIGLSFESLYLAKKMQEKGLQFHIIDENDIVQESPFLNPLDSFFHSAVSSDIASKEQTLSWKTYESGQWQPFVGFGSKKSDFDYSIYLNEKIYRWQKDKSTYMQELLEQFSDKISSQEKLTQIHVDEENKTINEIIVNDQKSYKAQVYVWTNHFKNLDHFLSPELIGKRNLQKLAKSTFWTRLDWHLLHDKNFEAPSATDHYILMGGSDEARPCLGQFYQNPEGRWCSQWSSFLETKVAENAEDLGNLLREMKRQVKRPFPKLFESVEFDKIQILSDIYNTYDQAIDGSQKWLDLCNAKIFNHNFHSFVHKQNISQLSEDFLQSLDGDFENPINNQK